MNKVGDLEFKFDDIDQNIPLVLQKWAQPVEEVLCQTDCQRFFKVAHLRKGNSVNGTFF